MARKATKSPDSDETRTTDQGTRKEQHPMIPKAKRLGGTTYIIAASVSPTRKPIPKKHRKSKRKIN